MMILKGDIEEAVGVALDGGVVRGPVIRIVDVVIKYMIGGTREVVKDVIVKMMCVMIRIKDIMARIKDTGEVRGEMIGIKDRMVKVKDPAKIKDTTKIKDITVGVRGEAVITGRTGNNNVLMLVILALGTTSQIIVNNREGPVMRNMALWLQSQDRNTIADKVANHHTAEEVSSKAGAFTVVALLLDPLEVKGAMVMTG